MPTRFFLAQDNSCHWYIVPVDKRADWDAWTGLDESDERSWTQPEFAWRIDGSPSNVTFSDPIDNG